MIIAIVGEKGGTGKTTTATNIAQIRASEGHDVLLLDTDSQGSASGWSAIRDMHETLSDINCLEKTGNAVAKEVKNLAERYEDIVIDAGGRDSVEMRGAMAVANKIFIPIQATQFDIMTVVKMNELVETAQAFNPELEAFLFINRASTNVRVSDHSKARKLITSAGLSALKLANTTISDRQAFKQGAEKGMGVCEIDSQSKASNEIMKLYKEMF